MNSKLFKCIKRFVMAPCCLVLGWSCTAMAEDFSSFAQYDSTYANETSDFASMPLNQSVNSKDSHSLNLKEAFMAVLFQQGGVEAFGLNGSFFAPSDGKGFIIERQEADLKFQYKF